MVNYPYTQRTGSLKHFFEKIPVVGKPDRVTNKYIYSLGFKSTNDRAIVPLLKFLKFLDATGAPTERYMKYRDKSISKAVLGAAIQETYSAVFQTYPNAPEKGNTDLENFFSTQSGLGEKAVKSIVNTFKALCSIATFDKMDIIEETMEDETAKTSQSKSSLHTLDLTLSEGRRARIIVPHDINKSEIDKLKRLLDVLR